MVKGNYVLSDGLKDPRPWMCVDSIAPERYSPLLMRCTSYIPADYTSDYGWQRTTYCCGYLGAEKTKDSENELTKILGDF